VTWREFFVGLGRAIAEDVRRFRARRRRTSGGFVKATTYTAEEAARASEELSRLGESLAAVGREAGVSVADFEKNLRAAWGSGTYGHDPYGGQEDAETDSTGTR